jgi:hypothetical protein
MDPYKTFYQTFLAEMPQRAPGGNDFAAQLEMLQENLKYGVDVTNLLESVFKAEINEQVTYWVGNEDATVVSLIVDTTVSGTFCKVELSSKNPSIPHGTGPFVSDLYLLIKKDLAPAHLVFSSDNLLSDDGAALWKGLVNRGHAVSVYDTSTHQYVLDRIDSIDTLNNYVGGADKQKYVFVLSESRIHRQGAIHSMNIMEIKRKALWPMFEKYQQKD